MNHSKSYENLKNTNKKVSQARENALSDLNSKRNTLNTWSREKKLEKLANYVSCQVNKKKKLKILFPKRYLNIYLRN